MIMSSMNAVDWIAVILTVIGGVNWGLVGIFGTSGDVVAQIFGGAEMTGARVVYVIVGVAALWLIYTASKMASGGSADSGAINTGGTQPGGGDQQM